MKGEKKMSEIKGFDKLTNRQKEMLSTTHSLHMKMMGAEMRKEHTIEHIKEVKAVSNKVVAVYFDNGNSWEYEDCEWS